MVLAACSRFLESVQSYILNSGLFGASAGVTKAKDKFTVVVEGNIASGKTTLLNHFKDNTSAQIFPEPVNKWRNISGHNALAHFYEEPSRWGFTLQSYVQLTMLETHLKSQNKPVKLMERSIYSAKYCFVENLYKSGKMTELEHIILSRWFDWILTSQDVSVDLIVYLRTQPETLHERIKKRSRKEEQVIPLEYLQTLHDLHEDWLIKQTKYKLPAPVLVLDADSDLTKMSKVYELHKERILCGLS